MLGCHVDDVTAIGLREELTRVKLHLHSVFGIQDFGPIEAYLGMKIERDRNLRRLFISQSDYAKKVLEENGMANCCPVSTPMVEKTIWEETSVLLNEKEKSRYQSAIGSLLYLMHGLRPDIAYSVIRLSQYSAKPEQHHWKGVKRILRYVKGTLRAGIVLGNKSSDEVDGLVGYFDAAHADTPSMWSTCSYIFLLCGSPISWVSKVQKMIALSITEAEYMAGTEAAREAIYLKGLTNAVFVRNRRYMLYF